ncbi:MAG: phage tail tube protein [Jatrophihabitans sp.]|uniref:phage tail tube protein n=1 Tax=Jatrophihabitans sp. TaxID=1932789 RepID=UPI003F822EC0
MALAVGPARLLQVAIGKELTYGSAVTPTVALPVASCSPVDLLSPIIDNAWRGSVAGAYGAQPGRSGSQIDVAGSLYGDLIGWLLVGILGSDAVTGASAPYTHTITPLNSGTQQPPSYTIVTSDSVGGISWPGCKVASLNIEFGVDKAASFAAQLVGLSGAAVSKPAASFSSVPMLASWAASLKVGGTVDGSLQQLTLQIQRAIASKSNSDGSLQPYLQRSGLLTVNGTATFVLTSDTYRQWAQSTQQTSIEVSLSSGSGASLQSLDLRSSSADVLTAARNYGQKWVECAVSWQANGSTADVGSSGGWSPLQATLQNAIGAGVYS